MRAMNNPQTNDLEDLISRALRGKLTKEEQTQFEQRLQADASLRQRFKEEQRLERLLECVPKFPVPTNFTSLVLQAVRREQRQPAKTPGRGWFRFTYARVTTGLAVVLAAGLLVLQQYRQAERNQMARSVSAFTEVASVISSEKTPPTAVFQDFEAIQQLSLPADAELDLELLVALQR
jgi:anti-sigma factor RsiW